MKDWTFYKIGHKCDKFKQNQYKYECLECPVKNLKNSESGNITTNKIIRKNNIYSISLIPTSDPYTHKYAGTIIKIENITESERSNEQLKLAKERAEKADKLKSLFLANMSHEIRTPLNAIVGFSELMVNCDDKEDRGEFSKIINSNNRLLLQLITDILDLSKIESGTLDFNFTDVNLGLLLEDTYNTFLQQCSDKGISLIFKHDNNITTLIKTDPLRLQQVVSNFLTNALKFTNEGEIEMGYTIYIDNVKIYVRDTGIGISDDKLEIIFDRFVKLDSFAQGVGLGLSICVMIAGRLNGNINVESKLSEGSTFWLTIPNK